MVSKYKVITLCGSTRFKEQFLEAQKRLTLEGNIVISVGLFGHSGDDEVWTEGTKAMLDDMHKRKIDMADAIYVINVGGYVGSSTRSEIEYARSTGKEVLFLEDDGSPLEENELLKRVREMEARYDKLASILAKFDAASSEYKEFEPELEILKEYMDSGQWKADFEADEAGEIPAGVKRGVLSEDGLYNLLQRTIQE